MPKKPSSESEAETVKIQRHPNGVLQDGSLLSIITSAQTSIPAFRYIVGFAAAAALLVTVLRAWNNPPVLVFGAIIMVLGGVLIRIFGRSVKIQGRRLNFAAEVLIYYVLAVVVFITTMLVSSVFFNAPVPLRTKIFGGNSGSGSEAGLEQVVQDTENAENSETASEAAGTNGKLDKDNEKFTSADSLGEAVDLVRLSPDKSLAVVELDADPAIPAPLEK
jgi:hypothetical protein